LVTVPSVTVTVIPGTTAALLSVTVPAIAPVLGSCAPIPAPSTLTSNTNIAQTFPIERNLSTPHLEKNYPA
jgi:hypothetical protein